MPLRLLNSPYLQLGSGARGLRIRRATVTAPVEYVPGGLWENAGDETKWTIVGAAAGSVTRVQTPTPASGSWCGLVTMASSGTANVDSQPIAVTAGATVPDLIAKARWVTGATPRNARLDLRFFTDAGGTTPTATGATSTGTSTATSTATWVTMTRSGVVVPATAVTMRVRIVSLSVVAAEACAWDDIKLA